MEGSIYIATMARLRVLYRERDGGKRTDMQDVVDSFSGGAHRSSIAQVGLPEVDLSLDAGEVGRLPGQIVVYPPDLLSAFYQGSGQG